MDKVRKYFKPLRKHLWHCRCSFNVIIIETVNDHYPKETCYWLISLFFNNFFRATHVAHGSSQARGQIGAAAASLLCSHSNTVSKPWLWPTPQFTGNARSLTHWTRSGMEPTSLWILVRFLTTEPQQELLINILLVCQRRVLLRVFQIHWIHLPCKLKS